MNNQLTLIGYVGQAPRAVSFGDTGSKVVKFSLAVKEFSNNEESTLWIDVDAWNGLGERVMQNITKGREVLVTGRLATSVFNKEVNGAKVEVHKPILKLTSFHLCGKKPDAGSARTQADTPAPMSSINESSAEPAAEFFTEPAARQRKLLFLFYFYSAPIQLIVRSGLPIVRKGRDT